jgi:hypothetical protein
MTADDGYRIYVEAWDPSYGTPVDMLEAGLSDGSPAGESTAQLVLDVEAPPGAWGPLSPPPQVRAPSVVLLVDGVLRTDAWLWIEESETTMHPGLAASYAAGVVRCDLRRGAAEVAPTLVERGLFTPSTRARDLVAATARYPVRHVAAFDAAQLRGQVATRMQALEAEVAAAARAAQDSDDLLIADGPLRLDTVDRALGFIKTHRVQYLPAELSPLVGRLRAGQRTPVFLLSDRRNRFSWYLKLPGPAGSPWAGVVRVEASADLTPSEAIRLADLSAVTLPRFASTAYKDARAPQNLTPIAGLERRLRGMLGDQRLLLRSLSAAAAAQRAA